jgi:hypothetical protein
LIILLIHWFPQTLIILLQENIELQEWLSNVIMFLAITDEFHVGLFANNIRFMDEICLIWENLFVQHDRFALIYAILFAWFWCAHRYFLIHIFCSNFRVKFFELDVHCCTYSGNYTLNIIHLCTFHLFFDNDEIRFLLFKELFDQFWCMIYIEISLSWNGSKIYETWLILIFCYIIN